MNRRLPLHITADPRGNLHTKIGGVDMGTHMRSMEIRVDPEGRQIVHLAIDARAFEMTATVETLKKVTE